MGLTGKAKEILGYIVRFQREQGAPPTVREIGDEFGIRSTNGVCYHLDLLEREGAIRRRRGQARGIVLSEAALPVRDAGVPILGQIAAGGPVMSAENIEGMLNADRFAQCGASFALRVTGESMRDAGILDGDVVLVAPDPSPRKGDIVVAMIGDETTVKRFGRRGKNVILEPENPDFEPILVTAESPELRILGKVVAVYREFT